MLEEWKGFYQVFSWVRGFNLKEFEHETEALFMFVCHGERRVVRKRLETD